MFTTDKGVEFTVNSVPNEWTRDYECTTPTKIFEWRPVQVYNRNAELNRIVLLLDQGQFRCVKD